MDVQRRCATRAYNGGDGMIKVGVVYTDGTEETFECERVIRGTKVSIYVTAEGTTVLIPNRNVYKILEHRRDEVTE